jgi:hypothetical protein
MEAAMQQALHMRQERAAGAQSDQNQKGSGQPGGGGDPSPQKMGENQSVDLSKLPDLKNMTKADWAKLPPKAAEKLLENEREAISPEFREQINRYFLIIGERGRNKPSPVKQKK